MSLVIVESPDCAGFLVAQYLLPSSLIVHCADQCRAPSGHLGWSYHNSPLWLDNKLFQAFSQNLFKVIKGLLRVKIGEYLNKILFTFKYLTVFLFQEP